MQKVLRMVGGFALGAVILVGIFALGIWLQSLSKWDDGLAPVVVIPSITPAGQSVENNTFEEALDRINPPFTIFSAETFEISEGMQIIYMMPGGVEEAEAFMLSAICEVRGFLPSGYGIRFGAKQGAADGITLITALVEYDEINNLTCPASVSFESITSEYNKAAGLR